MMGKLLFFLTIFCLSGLAFVRGGAQVCYQCDDLNPSSFWKFWGQRITKCTGVPTSRYATKTSALFGSAVLTCYTKFNKQGTVIKRSAYGPNEASDELDTCRNRYHICCQTSFCNNHTVSPSQQDFIL